MPEPAYKVYRRERTSSPPLAVFRRSGGLRAGGAGRLAGARRAARLGRHAGSRRVRQEPVAHRRAQRQGPAQARRRARHVRRRRRHEQGHAQRRQAHLHHRRPVPTAPTPSRSRRPAPTCSVTRSARTGASPSTPASPSSKLAGSADEGRINTSPATFSGTTEPFSTVTVVGGGVEASGQADASGKYAVSANLPDGPSDVTITTADRAGNATTKQLQRLRRRQPADPQDDAARQDRRALRPQDPHQGPRPARRTQAQAGARRRGARATAGPPSRAVFAVKNLAQGKHTLVITASDKGGNVVTDKQTFVVDSTEHFGSAAMWPGARGKDVKELQKRLADAGVFDGPKTGVYDNHTVTGVKKFQAKYGMRRRRPRRHHGAERPQRPDRRRLGDLHLYLYRDDKLVKSYSVATGQPAYPTPTGTFVVVNMQMDPTWLPPNSDWAKDAKPIPPGADNPLGHPLDRHQRARRRHPRHAATTPPSAATPPTAASACTSPMSKTCTQRSSSACRSSSASRRAPPRVCCAARARCGAGRARPGATLRKNMAEVIPFRGIRYHESITLDEVVAPPYDVIPAAQAAELRGRSPHNAVHLDLPVAPGEAAEDAAYAARRRRLRALAGRAACWSVKRRPACTSSIRPTAAPTAASARAAASSRGFASPTSRSASSSRTSARTPARRSTACDSTAPAAPTSARSSCCSPTTTAASRPRSRQRRTPPPAQRAREARDGDGNLHRIVPLGGPGVERVVALLREPPLYIADGHHRYETALAYRDERRAAGDHSADTLMVYLCSMSDPGLTVFPTHRLVRGRRRAALAELLARLRPFFEVVGAPVQGLEACRKALARPGRAGRPRQGLRPVSAARGRLPRREVARSGGAAAARRLPASRRTPPACR